MAITIAPLELRQLASLEADPSSLDGVPVAAGALPPVTILAAAMDALRKGQPPIWSAPFVFMETQLNQIIGTGGFKGPPIDHRVEIGYGVAEQFRRNGFATAAVGLLLRVAFSEPGVMEVYAETAAGNVSSRRVVEKLGFRHFGQRATEDDGIVDQWLKSN